MRASFVDNEEKILKGEFEGSLINHISEVPANAYKHCADISLKRIYRSRDVLDIELAGFRIISTLLELMIDAVRSPEKAYSQLLINRVSGQYNIKAPALYERIQAVVGLHLRNDGCIATSIYIGNKREILGRRYNQRTNTYTEPMPT